MGSVVLLRSGRVGDLPQPTAIRVLRDMALADLIVITGPPGAGKSTVAQVVAESFDRSALVTGDTFFGFVAKGYIDP
jgi:2-phosphoglycerate kinase